MQEIEQTYQQDKYSGNKRCIADRKNFIILPEAGTELFETNTGIFTKDMIDKFPSIYPLAELI